MFSYRLKQAFCCCQVRTGALVVATLVVMTSLISLVQFIIELSEPAEIVDYYSDLLEQYGYSEQEADALANHMIGANKVVVASLVGQLAISGLLLIGLAKRKHTLCLPWLILNALYLITSLIALIIVVIFFWAAVDVGAGFIVLLVWGLGLAVAFYVFKVVQTEWMVIKDLDKPVEAELGNRPTAAAHYPSAPATTTQYPINNGAVGFEPLPAYPGRTKEPLLKF